MDGAASLGTTSRTDGAARLRVVVADDSALFRQGLARLLRDAGIDVAGEAGDAVDLARVVDAVRPDVAIVDVRMPPGHTTDGLEAALAIRRAHPQIAVLVLSNHIESHHALALLRDSPGRVGYLLKDRVLDIGELIESLLCVARGGAAIDPEVVSRLLGGSRRARELDHLTQRETEILSLMAEGRSNQAISDRLSVSGKTVEAHVRSIMQKLELDEDPADHRRVLAVLAYLRS